jgi:predicted O-methyltransferase YrrM
MSERVLLYALICGLQPERALEIGTLHGGSTMIMCAAMDDIDRGRIICVDPEPRVAPEHWRLVEHRATMMQGFSPRVLAAAAERAGGPFDFALIDGDHTCEGVMRDFEGVLEVLAPEGWMLFHDANNREVQEGIDACIAERADELHDAGILSVPAAVEPEDPEIRWGGFRLVRRGEAVPSSGALPQTGGLARLVRGGRRLRD